jgi:hypothetical protein
MKQVGHTVATGQGFYSINQLIFVMVNGQVISGRMWLVGHQLGHAALDFIILK